MKLFRFPRTPPPYLDQVQSFPTFWFEKLPYACCTYSMRAYYFHCPQSAIQLVSLCAKLSDLVADQRLFTNYICPVSDLQKSRKIA